MFNIVSEKKVDKNGKPYFKVYVVDNNGKKHFLCIARNDRYTHTAFALLKKTAEKE